MDVWSAWRVVDSRDAVEKIGMICVETVWGSILADPLGRLAPPALFLQTPRGEAVSRCRFSYHRRFCVEEMSEEFFRFDFPSI